MNINSFRLEEKLFSAIQKQAPSTSCWKKETMEILGLGKSAFYNRLSGQTPLHLKDAILLANHFNISMSLLFEHPKEEVPIKFLLKKNNNCDLKSSIDYLISQFTNSIDSNPYYFSATGLPFFYLAQTPPLFHFYLLFQIGFPLLPSVKDFEKIFLQTSSFSPITLQIEQLSKSVLQTKGVEWWNGMLYNSLLTIFDQFCNKNKADLKAIHYSAFFKQMENLHEKVSLFLERKIQEVSNLDHQIYISQNIPGFEFYLFYKNNDGKIISRFYNNLVEISEQKLINDSKTWMQNQIDGEFVFPISNHSRFQFYLKKSHSQIKDHIANQPLIKQSHFHPFI